MSALKAEIAFPEGCSWKVTSSILTKHTENNILLLRKFVNNTIILTIKLTAL